MVKLNRKTEDALAEQLSRIAAPPELLEHTYGPDGKPTLVKPAKPMAAEQTKPKKWPARISMTASEDMARALELARVDDGIEVTARLRAMITLWQDDPKLRARIDKLARDLR
jgi:hypothetical protein